MDIKTLAASMAVGMTVCAIAIVFFAILNRQNLALRYWAAAQVMMAISGYGFYSIATYSPIPHTFLYGFFTFSLLGAQEFFGLERRWVKPCIVSIPVYAAITFFLSLQVGIDERIVFSMTLYFLLTVSLGLILIKYSPHQKNHIGTYLGIFFVVHSFVYFARAGTAVFFPGVGDFLLKLLLFEGIVATIIFPLGFMLMVSEKMLKEKEEEACIDPLTGVLNRRAFYVAAEPALRRCLRLEENVSILVIDLDRFKSVNDNYGHVVGDKVLQKCANYIQESARDSDIFARFGGEEFVLLLPNTKLADAEAIANRLRVGFSRMIEEDQALSLCSTFSVGLYCHDSGNTDTGQLIAKADELLFQAKKKGRDCVVSGASFAH